jgi:serine/threonine protein phosphatase PrpC
VCTALRIEAAAGSHVGCVRPNNEDSFAAPDNVTCVVIRMGAP